MFNFIMENLLAIVAVTSLLTIICICFVGYILCGIHVDLRDKHRDTENSFKDMQYILRELEGVAGSITRQLNLISNAIQGDNIDLKDKVDQLRVTILEVNQIVALQASQTAPTPLTSEEFKEVMRNFQQLVQKVQAELTISFEKLDKSVAQSFIAGLGKK